MILVSNATLDFGDLAQIARDTYYIWSLVSKTILMVQCTIYRR